MIVWIATWFGADTATVSGTRSETETVAWSLFGVQDSFQVRVWRCVCLYPATGSRSRSGSGGSCAVVSSGVSVVLFVV